MSQHDATRLPLEDDLKMMNEQMKDREPSEIEQEYNSTYFTARPPTLKQWLIERTRALTQEVTTLKAERDRPWEHSEHWRNPDTGQIECDCCCGWALDAEETHKELAMLRSENERRWISVEERLPEVGGTYLIAGENKPFPMAVHLAHFVRFESGPVWSFDGHYKAIDAPNIKYWQPLPTPPAPGPTGTEEKAE